jgi:hypothetical protein
MLNTAEEALRNRIISLLVSPSVLKIDFRLAKYRVNGYGFRVVIGLLNMRAIRVVIDPDALESEGADALYHDEDDSYYFPSGMYGMSLWEKMAIVHESVHAILDAQGGGKYHRAIDNEAAAYVANALYALNLTNSVPPGLDKMRKLTFDVAIKLRADRSRVPTVSQGDLEKLRVSVGREYRKEYSPLTRDTADGNASPISILAPLYGYRK